MPPSNDTVPQESEDFERRKALWDRLRADPEDYEANLEMGLYCASRRKYALAAEPYLLKALSHRTSDNRVPEILYYIGRVAAMKGELERAAEIWSTLEGLAPENWRLSLSIAPIHHFLGDLEEASAAALRALDWLDSHAVSTAPGKPPRRLLWPADSIAGHFGELVNAVDFATKRERLGWTPPSEKVLVVPQGTIANSCLLDYCRAYVTVVTDPDEVEAVQRELEAAALSVDFARLPEGPVAYREVSYARAQAEWERAGHEPLFRLTPEHEARGRAALTELGVPDDAWFVALHARDLGTKEEEDWWPPERFRVAPLNDYLPAVQAITERGGYVVRLGDRTVKPLPELANVVDYPRTAQKSDWMDIYLIASCRFMLGSPAGPLDVGRCFGVPMVAANWFPPATWPALSNAIFIPKILVNADTGRPLSVKETVSAPNYAPNAYVLENRGITVENSDPEDIADAVREMLDRLDGTESQAEDDADREKAFWKYADPFSIGFRSTASRSFLRRHPELLAADG